MKINILAISLFAILLKASGLIAQCNYNFTFTNAGGTLYLDNTPNIAGTTQILWEVNGAFASNQNDPSFSPQGGPGIYTICMTVNNQSCTPTTVYVCDTVHIGPDSCHVTVTHSIHGDTVFFDNTPNLTTPPSNWSWNIASQNAGSVNDPYFVMAGPGTYSWFAVFSKQGCPNVYIMDSVQVGIPCTYNFSYTENLGVIHLNNLPNVSPPATINWSVNATNFSTQNDPYYVSPGPGSYTICMTVVDMACQPNPTTYLCDTITIQSPLCNYNFTYSVSNDTVTLLNSPQVNAPATVYWTYNNNLFATTNDPVWIAPSPGTYNICMVVTDANCPGGQALICDSVTIAAPSCNYSFSYTQSGNQVTLTNTPAVVAPASITWSVNSTNFSTSNNPVWTAPGNGTYVICMTVVDMSCQPNPTFFQCDTITIAPPCTYTLVDNSNWPMYIYTTNPPVVAPATITWYMGTINLGTNSSVGFSGTTLPPGLTTICAVINDPNCPSAISLCDTIGSACNYSFTSVNTSGNSYLFDNTPVASNPATISWTVNGSPYSTTNDPSWTAPGPGTYIICMTVVDIQCQPNATFNQCDTIVIPTNSCNYGFTYTIREDSVFFNNTPNVISPATIQWTVNGNPISTQNDPLWISPAPGIYAVCMLIVDPNCNPNPTIYVCDTITVLPTNCQYQFSYTSMGDTVFLDNTPQVIAPATIQWTVNGNPFSTQNDPSYYLNQADTFVFCMLVVDMTCTLMPTQLICDTVINYPVGIAYEAPISTLDLHPNPAQSEVHISWKGSQWQGEIQFELCDIQGRVLQQWATSGDQVSTSLNRQNLPDGIYLLSAKSTWGHQVLRVIFSPAVGGN